MKILLNSCLTRILGSARLYVKNIPTNKDKSGYSYHEYRLMDSGPIIPFRALPVDHVPQVVG